MPNTKLQAPFPYFGGKRRVSDVVWQALGDVQNYVEPFFGSGAVLLSRPNYTNRTETANELNPYVANFWRATKLDPEQVAHYANWPVIETDLHARHLWLVQQDNFRQAMLDDPEYYDAKIAGWWVWGICSWIGSGWCDSKHYDKDTVFTQIPHLANNGRGINRPSNKLPRLSEAGNGIHKPSHQLPSLSEAGHGGHRVQQDNRETWLNYYFPLLSERLSRVRFSCGDWSRVVTKSVTFQHGMTGIFFDPPYTTGSDLYNGVATSVANDVLQWCKDNWYNKQLRIALCGYEGEFDIPADWVCHSWKAPKGYQHKDNDRSDKERIWFSPSCLPLSDKHSSKQLGLFDATFSESEVA